MQVRGDRDRAFLVGGVDDAEHRLGRVDGHGQQADIVDHEQIDADQFRDRPADGVVGAVSAQQLRECLWRVPRDRFAAIDREVPERFDQVAFAGAGRVVVALLMLWRFCRIGCG